MRGTVLVAVWLTSCTMQGPDTRAETLYRIAPATWFEDGFSSYDVSSSGIQALFRSWYGVRLIDVNEGREEQGGAGDLDTVRSAVFDYAGTVVRFGERDGRTGWFGGGDAKLRLLPLPPGGLPFWSPDGEVVAYDMGRELRIGAVDDLRHVALTGSVVGVGWGPDSNTLFALVSGPEGSSSLIRISEDGVSQVVRTGLDGSPLGLDRVSVSPNGRFVYLSLVGDGPPDREARHRPNADRDTDIYALELATGRLRAVVADPGDDFYPIIAGNYLYWTHNDFREQVVVVPIEGGEARIVVQNAQIPYWSHDGRRLAFTVGGWRIADWALNLDAAVVDVDPEGRALGTAAGIVVGYHEDFTPVWSPDGKWIAYHSHRSAGPVASYYDASSSDDIYLRRTAPGSEEIRVTDFGWEVGNPSWAPDSRRLVLDSQDRSGVPGVVKAWIVHIDSMSGRPQRIEPLSTPEGPPGFRVLSWSPTAEEIALTYPVSPGRFALAVASPAGQPTKTLLEFEASTQGGVGWTPDGKRIIYSALADGRMQLFIIDRRGGQPRRLTNDSRSLILPQVSPSGRWIAATRIARVKELRRIRLPDRDG